MTPIHRRPPDERGFTLVELMVGIVLSSIAMAVLMTIFVSTQSMYGDTQAMATNQGDVRAVSSLMAHEIRSAGSDASEMSLQRIVIADTDSMRFQSDLNGDGVLQVTEPAEDITYYYDSVGKRVLRNGGGSAIVVLESVSSFAFEYLDGQGNVLTPTPLDPTQRMLVRAVRVTMNQTMPDGANRNIQTVISLRNR